MFRQAERVRDVERKLLIGSALTFFFLGAYLTGGSLVLATILLVAVSTGCLLHPIAERIVARDLSLYSLLDPASDEGRSALQSRLRQLDRYAHPDEDDSA